MANSAPSASDLREYIIVNADQFRGLVTAFTSTYAEAARTYAQWERDTRGQRDAFDAALAAFESGGGGSAAWFDRATSPLNPPAGPPTTPMFAALEALRAELPDGVPTALTVGGMVVDEPVPDDRWRAVLLFQALLAVPTFDLSMIGGPPTPWDNALDGRVSNTRYFYLRIFSPWFLDDEPTDESRRWRELLAWAWSRATADVCDGEPLVVNVDGNASTIVLFGTTYPVTERQAEIIQILLDNEGGFVSSDKLVAYPGKAERPGRILFGRNGKGGLPEPLQRLIEKRSGGGGGFRLRIERLSTTVRE